MPGASNEGIFPSFVRFLIPFCNVTKKSLSPWRLLTVKLRGRTTTPDRGRGPAISTGSRGPKQTTPHGPLQRWLDGGTSTGGLRLEELVIAPFVARPRECARSQPRQRPDQSFDQNSAQR